MKILTLLHSKNNNFNNKSNTHNRNFPVRRDFSNKDKRNSL